MKQKILGIGNALVDILTRIQDENILKQLHLPKGSMQLVDTETSTKIGESLSSYDNRMAAGGSAANTVKGLAGLGIETGFISMVGKDNVGQFFEKELIESHVKPLLFKSDTPTGRAHAIITPDGERTFATCLGASLELSAALMRPELFENWNYLYVEGYLVENRALLETAIQMASDKGLKIVLDLASYNVVEDNRDYLLGVIEKWGNIVFANEEEAKALTGLGPEESLHFIAKRCDIAIVKIGSKGSLIQKGAEEIAIAPRKSKVIDTTGAGDMFAAGFLAGLVNGKSLEMCGKTGSILAGNIIEVIGTKMDDCRWENIHKDIKSL
jgi:Sugar kinases, ribokinase family